MPNSPELTSNPITSFEGGAPKPAHAATIVYQCVTVAAMLILLGTLWVF